MTDRTYRADELLHYFPEEEIEKVPFGVGIVVKLKHQPDSTVGFISGIETDPYEDAYKTLSEVTKRLQKNAGIEPLDDVPLIDKVAGNYVYRVEWSSPPIEADFSKFSMPLIGRVYTQPIANQIVSVQPMSLPSGMNFYLNYTYGKNTNPCGETPLDTIKEEYTIGDDSCKEISQSTSGTALEKSGWGSGIRTAFTCVSTGVKSFVRKIVRLAGDFISFSK
jgi:hypothetical protein